MDRASLAKRGSAANAPGNAFVLSTVDYPVLSLDDRALHHRNRTFLDIVCIAEGGLREQEIANDHGMFTYRKCSIAVQNQVLLESRQFTACKRHVFRVAVESPSGTRRRFATMHNDNLAAQLSLTLLSRMKPFVLRGKRTE